MIRQYKKSDLDAIKRMHEASGLPPECLPDLTNPNFRVKIVADHAGHAVLAGFVKRTAEAFVLVDHDYASPQERLDALDRLVAYGLNQAAVKMKVDDVSAWLPPELEQRFGERLKGLGFVRSPWRSYTAILK